MVAPSRFSRSGAVAFFRRWRRHPRTMRIPFAIPLVGTADRRCQPLADCRTGPFSCSITGSAMPRGAGGAASLERGREAAGVTTIRLADSDCSSERGNPVSARPRAPLHAVAAPEGADGRAVQRVRQRDRSSKAMQFEELEPRRWRRDLLRLHRREASWARTELPAGEYIHLTCRREGVARRDGDLPCVQSGHQGARIPGGDARPAARKSGRAGRAAEIGARRGLRASSSRTPSRRRFSRAARRCASRKSRCG
jgi:hypothetical protein